MGLAEGENHFIRLERLRVNRESEDGETRFAAVVESREYYGLYIKYYLNVGGVTLKVIEKNDGINIYESGENVTVGIHRRDVMSYPAQ